MTGRPVGASVTCPAIVPVGAWAGNAPATSAPVTAAHDGAARYDGHFVLEREQVHGALSILTARCTTS